VNLTIDVSLTDAVNETGFFSLELLVQFWMQNAERGTQNHFCILNSAFSIHLTPTRVL